MTCHARTLVHVRFNSMPSDNGGQMRKKETATANEMEVRLVQTYPVGGGVGGGRGDEVRVGNTSQGSGDVNRSGDVNIGRSLKEDSIPLLGAEGNVEGTPGDSICSGCGVVPTNGVLRASRQDYLAT